MEDKKNMRKLNKIDIEKLPPARASLVVEAVLSEKRELFGNREPTDENECGTSTSVLSKEQLLKIQIKLPDIHDETEVQAYTHLVLVVDKSGSMAGNAWCQVQASVKDIIGCSITQPGLKTDLIIYGDNAHVVEFTANNYEKVISDLKAGGMTNFKAAFTKVNRVVSEAGEDYSKTVIVFMTDGADTVNPKEMLPQMPTKLAERWGEIHKDVVIHTVGFTSVHDFNFLKKLSEEGGTSAGMFRYCEPNDDKEALKYKLDELFDFILAYDGDNMEVGLSMDGEDNNFLGIDIPSQKTTVQGKIIPESEATNSTEVVLTAEAWVQLSDPYDLPNITVTVTVVMPLEEGRTAVTIPCILEKTEFNVLDTPDDKVDWRLKILSRNVDMFINRVGKAISDNGDVSGFQEKIEKFQKQVSHTRVFGNGITRERRLEIFEVLQDIQKNLDQVQNMLAQYVRGGTQSISLLARAHDMRYQAVFSKSRRQRIMDKRASKNMQQASAAQESLSSLIVDEQEVKQLSQDAVGFYFCMLSQNSIQDVLLGDDKEDAIGFGLAVKRNEVVLDEPTMIQIWVISGTLVSRTAMLDALEHKINVSSHLSAHGGFDFAKTQLGVTTVGIAREPINAWLPLYVTKSHWDRVKVILKPALGSFCTLDPLGYDYKQIDVMFMTLGSMIGQLRKENVGEYQLKLLFALLRTCAACLKDFDMSEQVAEFVDKFVSSPAGRTKDVIPNLFTLIGYIVSMPTEQMRRLFCIEVVTESRLPKLWLSLISECIRRAAGNIYRDSSTNTTKGLIDAILHGTSQGILASNQGRVEPAVCRTTAEISRLCLSHIDDAKVADFDPAAGVTVPEIELCHSQKVDRAMEIWAEREAGYVKNVSKAKSKQTTDAKKIVQHWVRDGEETLGIENTSLNQSANDSISMNQSAKPGIENKDEPQASSSTAEVNKAVGDAEHEHEATDDSGNTSYNPHHVTASMLQVLAQLHNKLCQTAYASMQSLPGSIAFVNTWLSKNRNLVDIDNNSGVVPEEWVQEIKAAITKVYGDMEAFTRLQETVRSSSNTEVWVTMSEGQGQQVQTQEEQEVLVVPDQQTENQNQTETVVDNTDKDDEDDLDLYSDSDDYFEDYLNDDSDDEIAFEARRQMKKKKRKEKLFKVTVPMLLHQINPDLDITLMLRGIVCQALRFHRNSSARGAITTTGQFLDLGDGADCASATLTASHKDLQEYRDTVRKGLLEKVLWKRANYCMVHASTVWAFIGYLMNIHKERGEGFNDLIDLFVTSAEAGTLPYLKEKVHVLLTGKYKDCVVFANGNQWLPEKKMVTIFKTLLGEETWMKFEVELRSAVQIHVYRESDIPNRHGHCNSNPYIPNALRLKLGMALLPEPNRRSAGKRTYLRNSKTS